MDSAGFALSRAPTLKAHSPCGSVIRGMSRRLCIGMRIYALRAFSRVPRTGTYSFSRRSSLSIQRPTGLCCRTSTILSCMIRVDKRFLGS
eukprot:1004294-Pyramimonas_sp.AAC.1